ncbi:hypothetical protein DEO72_LG8g1247 [Vigna unguiculata]|uniref:Uncharacterized protein n=1 Tax=Vigna unguiculata TaxID=3917 RepID=A0A4D6MTN1_VIGUN|nr:hypothetical protein DEO72_LG8g1247 [Vigna unguiculata]
MRTTWSGSGVAPGGSLLAARRGRGVGKTIALEGRWRLAAGRYRQAEMLCHERVRSWMVLTCDDMSGERLAARASAPGDWTSVRCPCTVWRLAARMCSARRCWKNSGAGRALAPGGGHEPPSGLGLFRQAMLAGAPDGCAPGHESCELF